MDTAAAEIDHQLKYGKTAASLDAEDKARTADVFARMALSEEKRATDRAKRETKRECVLVCQTRARCKTLVHDTDNSQRTI